jgi:hypothetical protein
MRKLIFALAIGALAVPLATPTSAQTQLNPGWPVCLAGAEEGSTRCEFASIAQCQAINDFRRGTCIINPAYRTGAYSYAYAQMRPWMY